jgi:hypothetical protein
VWVMNCVTAWIEAKEKYKLGMAENEG